MSKTKELEFKEVFLGKRMHGIIKGLELPKFYKDFTSKDKIVLYWHNPSKTIALFKDVSFIGPRSIKDDKPKEQEPKLEHDEEQQETNEDDK